MIDLPLKVKATGHKCVPASVTMVCAYWRLRNPSLDWKLPEDVNDNEWQKFYDKGLKYVGTSGMPFVSVDKYLKTLNVPLKPRLQHLTSTQQLMNFVNALIPPIVFYNQDFALKGEKGIGHAVIVLDKTLENIVTADPSLLPKCIHQVPIKDFEEAWKLEQNSAIVISPKSISYRWTKIPTTTLEMYYSMGVPAHETHN
jgi:hypothetical protein